MPYGHTLWLRWLRSLFIFFIDYSCNLRDLSWIFHMSFSLIPPRNLDINDLDRRTDRQQNNLIKVSFYYLRYKGLTIIIEWNRVNQGIRGKNGLAFMGKKNHLSRIWIHYHSSFTHLNYTNVILCNANINKCLNQLHVVSRTQQGSEREPSVKTLRSPLSAEFWRHCVLGGRTQRRA